MLTKVLLTAALATSSASAFLLPPPTDVQAERDGKAQEADGHSGFHILPFDMSNEPQFHELAHSEVPCPGCTFPYRKSLADGTVAVSSQGSQNDDILTMLGMPNHLALDFRIDHAASHDRLLVNGFEMFPDVDVHSSALEAKQVPDRPRPKKHRGKHHKNKKTKGEKEEHVPKTEEDHQVSKRHMKHVNHNNNNNNDNDDGTVRGIHPSQFVEVPLGYSVQMHTVGKDESNGMDVVAMTLQIIEVDHVFVQGIPAVHLRLIRTAENGLMIGDVQVDEVDKHTRNRIGGLAKLEKELAACSNVFCRWRVIMEARIKGFRGCAGGKASKSKSKQQQHNENVVADMLYRPENRFGHPATFYSVRERSWGRLFHKFGSHVLMPVVVGLAAGVLVSLIGMMVGTVMVGMWRVIAGRGRGRSQSHSHHHRHHRRHSEYKDEIDEDAPELVSVVVITEEVSDPEKAQLMAMDEQQQQQQQQDVLPTYEEKTIDSKTEA